MSWRIWYADGRSTGSEDCAPGDVPGHGALVVAQPDDRPEPGNVGYVLLSGDWFYWRTDSKRWYPASDIPALMDLVLHREPIVGICQGRYLPDAQFQAVRVQAAEWAEAQGLPRKSGRRRDERA